MKKCSVCGVKKATQFGVCDDCLAQIRQNANQNARFLKQTGAMEKVPAEEITNMLEASKQAYMVLCDFRERGFTYAKTDIDQLYKDALSVLNRSLATATVEKKISDMLTAAEERASAFVAELESLSSVIVSTDGQKIEKRNIYDVPELKYTNITPRSSVQILGNYIAIDTETTGIRATSSIVEVSAIRFVDYQPVELFTTLVKPSISIPADASEVNGITDDMVSDAPRIWEIMPSLNAFVSGSPLVGHNLPFDLQYLYRDGLDLQPKQKLYDTLALISSLLKKPRKKWDKDDETYYTDYDCDYDVEDYKLGTLCDYYNIPFVGAHRSSADCLATGKLFHYIVQGKT